MILLLVDYYCNLSLAACLMNHFFFFFCIDA